MENVNFETMTSNVAVPEQVETKKPQQDEKKARIKKMEEAFATTLAQDETFEQRLGLYSDAVEVSKVLFYGLNGNIKIARNANGEPLDKDGNVVDKAYKDALPTGTKPVYQFEQVGVTVGYIVKNIGTDPISYTTEEFAPNAEGKWVGKVVTKVIKPGEEAALSRKYMTIFCSIPEISFTLANGKIIRGSARMSDKIDVELESHYFSFNKGDDSKGIHDQDVAFQIEVKDAKTPDGKDLIKPEFEATFGFLYNDKEPQGRKTKEKVEDKHTMQQKAANLVQTLMAQQGL